MGKTEFVGKAPRIVYNCSNTTAELRARNDKRGREESILVPKQSLGTSLRAPQGRGGDVAPDARKTLISMNSNESKIHESKFDCTNQLASNDFAPRDSLARVCGEPIRRKARAQLP